MVNLALENNISSLVYMSSVGALDPVKPGEMITEENYGNNPKRSSRYAETKFKSELEVWRGIEEGLNAVIVNPSVVLGPGLPAQGPGKIFQRLRKGLRYYPQGITGFVDVRDVCHSTLQLFDEGVFNERFIISEGNYAYKDLFEMICHEMGVKAPKKPLSPNLTALAWRLEKARSKLFNSKPQITKEIHRSANNQVYFSNEKIKEQLGYEFIPIKQTIKDTTLFYNFQD
jgi:nucleoside-diphosphate-sugar epimerase